MEEIKRIEPTIDNKLELLKYTSEVQSRIAKDISSDFTLAKLELQDKEGITELTADAYFAQRVIQLIAQKAKKWHWTNQQWTKTPITKEQTQQILQIAKTTFDAYMTRIYMTVILNRNVDKNYLINILAQQNTTEEQEIEEPKTIKDKTKQIIQNEEIPRQ